MGENPESSGGAKVYAVFDLLLILFSIACFMLDTTFYQVIATDFAKDVMEAIVSGLFTIQYILRLMVCDATGFSTKRKFILNPMNMCDILAILPFYLQLILATLQVDGLRVMRVFRLIRL